MIPFPEMGKAGRGPGFCVCEIRDIKFEMPIEYTSGEIN